MDNLSRSILAKVAAGLIYRSVRFDAPEETIRKSTGNASIQLYKYTGAEFVQLAIEHGYLGADSNILDIGCGCGRMAFALSCIIDDRGSYVGFDPLKEQIAFSIENIKHEKYAFHCVDLRHRLYNPNGVVDPDTYKFPAADNSIDIVISGSVLTHLELATAKHHLRETARVLRIGGKAFYYIFVLADDMIPNNSDITELFGEIRKWSGPVDQNWCFRFARREDGFWTNCNEDGSPKCNFMKDDVGDPMAFEYDFFELLAMREGLKVDAYLPGAWCRERYEHSSLDVVILEKT